MNRQGNNQRRANDFRARVAALAPLAKRVDVAANKLQAAGDDRSDRVAFNDAHRRAGDEPTAENLAALEAASKKLRGGTASGRPRLEAEKAEAIHAFRLALGRLASDIKPGA